MSEREDLYTVGLPFMVWADVCAALQLYINEGCKEAPASRRDALFALREIDRVMLGRDELAPPDDVIGPGLASPAGEEL